jgi:hypothetical protein
MEERMSKSQIVLLAMLTVVTLGIAGCSHVGEDWKAAQAADTTEAYQDFLRQHPDSEFSVSAEERVKQLAEDRDWQQASKADTLDAYQQFVATHADGKWAQEARVRIENFQLTANGQPAPAAPAAEQPPPATAKPVAKPPVKTATKSKVAGLHMAQLGAFASQANAEAAWREISGRFPDQLKSLHPHYAVLQRQNEKPLVRLQVGVDSANSARELCAALNKGSQPCIPIG